MPHPWQPTAFLGFSIAFTVTCVLLIVIEPALWAIWLGALLADHVVLIGSGFVPQSTLLGPNLSRLDQPSGAPARVALTFDDGPDAETTLEILGILAAHGVRATFFCVGSKAMAHPDLVRTIAATGHEVGNHSWSHTPWFWFLGPSRLTTQITSTQQLIAGITGHPPRYFRAPAGIRSPLLDPVLARLGLQLISWSGRGFDTVDTDIERVSRRLTAHLGAGDILVLHDGASARDSEGRPIIVRLLPRLLETIRTRGLETVTLSEALVPQAGREDATRPGPSLRQG